MKRRVFARRRHAETKALRRLRLCAWLGAPAALTMILWEMFGQGSLPTTGSSAFAVVALAYSTSVIRVRDLTGEWRFF